MRAIRKILAAIYLVASACVVAVLACRLMEVDLGRFERALESSAGRIALLVCAAITAAGALIMAIRAFAERSEPTCVRVAGNPSIEVTLAALASTARRAAPGGDDVMIESVEGKVSGRDRSEVRLTIEAIAFTDQGLDELACRMQQRVREACERLLGAEGVTCRVRFLPSKTTIVTKEV